MSSRKSNGTGGVAKDGKAAPPVPERSSTEDTARTLSMLPRARRRSYNATVRCHEQNAITIWNKLVSGSGAVVDDSKRKAA